MVKFVELNERTAKVYDRMFKSSGLNDINKKIMFASVMTKHFIDELITTYPQYKLELQEILNYYTNKIRKLKQDDTTRTNQG